MGTHGVHHRQICRAISLIRIFMPFYADAVLPYRESKVGMLLRATHVGQGAPVHRVIEYSYLGRQMVGCDRLPRGERASRLTTTVVMGSRTHRHHQTHSGDVNLPLQHSRTSGAAQFTPTTGIDIRSVRFRPRAVTGSTPRSSSTAVRFPILVAEADAQNSLP